MVDSTETEQWTKLQRYESRTTWALISAALLYLVLFSVDILATDLSDTAVAIITGASFVLYLFFVADWAIRVWLAPRRWRYVAMHPLDLLVLVFPVARVFRVLRIFGVAQVLIQRSRHISFTRVWLGLTLVVALLIYISALSMLDWERNATDSSITSFGDSLWWAFVTITTVGYGDIYPVTGPGKLIAVGLMIMGIGLIGSVTATLAGWLSMTMQGKRDDDTGMLLNEIQTLRNEIAQLRQVIETDRQ